MKKKLKKNYIIYRIPSKEAIRVLLKSQKKKRGKREKKA